MADFSALKTSIQNYIKQNGNEEITGNLLQQILLSMVNTLGDSAINDLVTALNNEVTARQNEDGTLQTNINNEATARGNADNTLRGLIDGITDDIENGYVYAGIATPSATPASGKVFYLALTAGTYTNFGATVVPQGVNILKYNGSAWTLDTFIGLDDAPTQGSNNLVKSGGVVDSIIKDGSAFDLSAYNSGTTYADLSAALTALNELPAVFKKGGMSVKFVQTSNNKYAQARLMANTFTTDITQWQGVDSEPTTGSKNLVESGGVDAKIKEITPAESRDGEGFYDENNNWGAKLDKDGNWNIKGLKFPSLTSDGCSYICDNNRNIALKISRYGEADLNLSKDSFIKSFDKAKDELPLAVKSIFADFVAPPYLFSVTNYCYSDTVIGHESKRNYAPMIYLDRFMYLKGDANVDNVTFIGGKTKHRISAPVFSGTSAINTIKEKIVGDKIFDKDINIPYYCSRNTNLINKNIRLLALGDSMTDADEWMTYMRKLALMDNIDYKKKTNTATDVIDIKLVGTMRAAKNESFTYRDVEVSVHNYNEGRSGWNTANYLRHADGYSWNMTNAHYVAWDALGLHSKYGDFGGSISQMALIADTCSGYWLIDNTYIPIVSQYTWNEYRSKIGYGSVAWENATSEQKAELLSYLDGSRVSGNILDNPINPFYSKDMMISTNGEYSFSWDAYYDRYKNYGIDGSELAEKGSAVISDSYVTIPNYVVINLGTNDNILRTDWGYQAIMDDVYSLGSIIKAQIGCDVIFFCPASVSPRFDDEFTASYSNTYNRSVAYCNLQFLRNRYMMSKFGVLSEQENNKLMYCPAYFIQRYGGHFGVSYQDIGEDTTTLGESIVDEDVHPCKAAYDDWGYEVYSMLNYLNR